MSVSGGSVTIRGSMALENGGGSGGRDHVLVLEPGTRDAPNKWHAERHARLARFAGRCD